MNWTRIFPPDLKQEEEIQHASNQHFAIGTEDEFYDEHAQDELVKFYLKKGFATHHFEGKHDIDAATLETILNKINAEVLNP